MLGPTLRGELVTLEPARKEDGPQRLGWFANLELSRFWTSPGVPSLAQEEGSVERAAADHTVVLWRITGQGRLIGSAWLSNIAWLHRQASSGMVIGDRADWGQGYGSEVVSLRTAFAFQELGLERLETFSLDTNVGMHRALERSGFRRIGVRSRHFLVAGDWHDAYIFELNRADWLRR